MSFALILFDYDGCTSVVPSSRFGPNVRVSEKHTFKYNGKDHLVEVLDVSDSKSKLNNFENEWTESHRSKALDREKRLRSNEGSKFGGFLSVWPEEDKECDGNEEQSVIKTRKEAVIKLKRANVSGCTKKIQNPQNPPALSIARKRKAVSAIQGANKQAKRSATSAKTTGKDVATARPETVTRNLSRTASTAKKTRTKPTVSRTKIDPRNGVNTLALAKTAVNKDSAPKETTAAVGSKAGSNGRSITVLFEGACDDGSTEVALPGRQPVFTQHLTSDQTELLTSRLTEYSSGKRSVGVQTDNVIMFSDTNELKKAGQVPTNETGVNTNSSDNFNQYDNLRLKIDEVISILTNDINKKLEDLLTPQSISFLPTSTPLHDHSTMRSQKNAKNGAVKTLLLPDVPLGQPPSEDELTGLTDVPLNPKTDDNTHVGSGPITDSFQSSNQTDFASVVTTALAQNGVACHSDAINVPANNVCSLSPVQSSATALTSGVSPPALTVNDLAPLDLRSSTMVHSSVTNPTGNSTPDLVGNGLVCVPSNQAQNGVACLPLGVTSSSSIHSSIFPVPLGLISSTSSHNSRSVEPGCVSIISSASHNNNTAAVLGTVSINPPASVCNSISDVPGDVNASTPVPFTAIPLGVSSSPLISSETRPKMLVENQVCNVPVGAKSHELSQGGLNSQSAETNIPAFSQINDSSLSVDRNSIANQICIPSTSIMASSNAATPSVSADMSQKAIDSFQITESCDLGQSNVCSQPVAFGSSYLSALSQIGNSSVGNYFRPSGDVEAQARQPLSILSHGQLNRGQNFAEIKSFEDMKNVGSSCKVRIAKEHMRSKKASSAHAGSFAWNLAQDIYTANELEGRNFNGNYGKQGLSPRRKEAIEEAVHDMYGADQKHIKAASKAINSGIRGKIFRATKNTNQNSAVSSWPAGVNLAGLMQLANIPTLQIHQVQNNA